MTALQQVVDTCQEKFCGERLSDIGIGTALVALYLMATEGTGSKEDDRDVAGSSAVLNSLTELQSVHDRHHHVGHDNIWNNLIGYSQSLLTICSLAYLILALQNGTQVGTYVGIIVDDEYRCVGSLCRG